MKAFKGFNSDMTCRDFQYKEGETYETDNVEICEHGFHACEYPLDVLSYYSPYKSIYHEVELDGEFDRENNGDDSKVAASKITIGRKLNIKDLVDEAIRYTESKVNPEASSEDEHGASSATGNRGASSATGDYGASSATGNRGASSATGYCGASSATGDCGASSATGNRGASSATGNRGASISTGRTALAYAGSSSSIAVAWGPKGKAAGVRGSHIVLSEWNKDDDGNWFELKSTRMIKVDGKKYKENTWYTMEEGKVVEADSSYINDSNYTLPDPIRNIIK